jgi:hypothetical protein
MGKFFVFLGYVWRIVSNVIQLLVVLYVFSKLKGGFDVIVIAVLGLIYTTLRTMGWALGMTFAKLGQGLSDEFIRLRRLLGDQTEEAEVELSEHVKLLRRQLAKSYIDLVFVAIISLYCIYQLLNIL